MAFPKNKQTQKNRRDKRTGRRKITSPNTFFIRHTADRLIAKGEGFCRLRDLQVEIQKKYRDIDVRYDMMVNYLIGGDYFIDCYNHRVMKFEDVDLYDLEEEE